MATTQETQSSPPQSGPRDASPCLTCGACCATSFAWPRFTTESDAALDLIPADLVDDSLGRMRCLGDRCAALDGEIGVATACTIYAIRPDVCRACQIGDDACSMAREKHGLPLIALVTGGDGPS